LQTPECQLLLISAACNKAYIDHDQVEREDLLDFATHCKKQGQKGKSIYNKLIVLSQLLAGIALRSTAIPKPDPHMQMDDLARR